MVSYAMCHLKLEILLAETGYKPKNQKRFQVYLTNSLEEFHKDTGTLFASWLSQEDSEANLIKRDIPVMVIIGNPPYAGESVNKGNWILKLLKDYKKESTGEPLKEKNSKWINDDYVKFIRYGEEYILKNGEGILSFITNYAYLDNPTFRGMRFRLLCSFDKIYIVDLHGNSKKKEIAPDGSKDENVFDIQQGVAIITAVKQKKRARKMAEVWHTDVYGRRQKKYDFLWKNSIKSINLKKIDPNFPYYFFQHKDLSFQKKYDQGFKITDLFLEYSAGVVTSRDEFVTDFKEKTLAMRIKDFYNIELESTIKEKYNLKEHKNFKIKEIKKGSFNSNLIKKISFRPFDIRYIYYSNKFIERSREKVMKNLLCYNNIGLVTSRQVAGNFNHVFITKYISGFNLTGTAGRYGSGYVFPLYLLNETDQPTLQKELNQRINFNKHILSTIEKKLNITFKLSKEKNDITIFNPINLFDYIYAVLHSPSYRKTYYEFLKINYPQIPYPEKKEIFWELVTQGKELRKLHLMESPVLNKLITSFPNEGNNKIEKVWFEDDDNGKVWINKSQYFDKVPKIVWEFYIGGYQPAQKWLKDRKGRELSFEDIQHYQKIIVALSETDRIMRETDKICQF